MKKDREKFIVSVHLFLMQDDKLLLLRRKNTDYEEGNYSVPAGHVEANETVTQAMIREAFEEVGIVISPGDLRFAHVMHRHEIERIDFFFVAHLWRGDVENKEPDKCDDLSWFPISDLPENTIPYIKSALKSFLAEQAYSERET